MKEEKNEQPTKEQLEDLMKSVYEEQLKLHPEIYKKDGEQ